MHAQATEHVWKVSVNANEDIVESVARRGRVEAAAVMVNVMRLIQNTQCASVRKAMQETFAKIFRATGTLKSRCLNLVAMRISPRSEVCVGLKVSASAIQTTRVCTAKSLHASNAMRLTNALTDATRMVCARMVNVYVILDLRVKIAA